MGRLPASAGAQAFAFLGGEARCPSTKSTDSQRGDDKKIKTMASVATTPSGSSGMDKYYSSKIGDLNSVSVL